MARVVAHIDDARDGAPARDRPAHSRSRARVGSWCGAHACANGACVHHVAKPSPAIISVVPAPPSAFDLDREPGLLGDVARWSADLRIPARRGIRAAGRPGGHGRPVRPPVGTPTSLGRTSTSSRSARPAAARMPCSARRRPCSPKRAFGISSGQAIFRVTLRWRPHSACIHAS